ncbi:hypothetical protein HID58_057535, partial [Brassica napus]
SEGALADDPIKVVDGIKLQCKLAIDGKKGKPLGQDVAAGPGPMGGGYGVPGAGSGPYRMPPRSMFAWSLRFDHHQFISITQCSFAPCIACGVDVLCLKFNLSFQVKLLFVNANDQIELGMDV